MSKTSASSVSPRRQIDSQNFEKMTDPKISTLGYLCSDWTFALNFSQMIGSHGGCVTVLVDYSNIVLM